MIIKRKWIMPNHNTFEMKPVREFINKNIKGLSCDPFARGSKLANITNDLNKNFDTDFNLDALDFLKLWPNNHFDSILFDPPYSLRQLKECYQGMGMSLTGHQSRKFYSDIRNEIERILKPSGIVLSFGWSSVGIGKKRGFELKEILLLCHGGNHNDTMCLKEVKL